jgi:peptidylprolyl isomerase
MTELSFVRLKDADLAKDVTVSEEDVKKAFDERKPQTDELRKVKFVSFLLPDAEKKLQGTERGAALQKLADRASDFAVAMTAKEAKFEDVALKAETPVAETPEFAATEPPKELNESQEAVQATFATLTMEQPNSDVIRSESGYYVLQLTGVTPARPLTIEEAKPKLEEALKKERVAEAAGLKATEIRNKIDAEIKRVVKPSPRPRPPRGCRSNSSLRFPSRSFRNSTHPGRWTFCAVRRVSKLAS